MRSGTAPRNADAIALTIRPIVRVLNAPKRAISSEPGTAAQANSTGTNPVRMPISVSDIRKSAWICGMTGGTARTASRVPLPASHNNATHRATWATVPVRTFIAKFPPSHLPGLAKHLDGGVMGLVGGRKTAIERHQQQHLL